MKLLLLTLIVCTVTGFAIAEDIVREEKVTVVLEADDLVSIDNINGEITVEGWDSEEVEVVYVITCENQEEMDAIEVVCDVSDGINCEVEYDADWDDNHSGEVTFMIKVPEDLELDYGIANVNGNVSISSAAGVAELAVVNGEVNADDFQGTVVIELVNGQVNVSAVPQLKEIDVVNGSIECEIDELNNNLFLSSVNGEISVNLSADVKIEIETIHGDVDIADSFDPSVRERTVGISASLGDGEHTIIITTVNGDIEVND